MRVTLRSIAGETAEVDAAPASTVGELEARAAELLGLRGECVRLVLGSEVLDSTQALSTCCIGASEGLSLLVVAAAAEAAATPEEGAENGAGAFDFDALDEDEAGAEARLVRLDGRGCPRGQCRACDCLEWLSGADEVVAQRPHAHNEVMPPGASISDRHLLSASAVAAGAAPGAVQPPEACRRCGCAVGWHEDLSRLVERLGAAGALVEADGSWDDLERTVYIQTQGLFHPGRDGRGGEEEEEERRAEQDAAKLVSVICPTSATRRCFHPSLYRCFCQQEYAAKELVVVETGGEGPSPFFTAGPPAADARVVYRHFRVPARRPWSVGVKRNVACLLAAGDLVAHFDDDDLYAPSYLAWSLNTLVNGAVAEGAAEVASVARPSAAGAEAGGRVDAVALTAWRTLRLREGTFGLCDAGRELPEDGRLSRRFRGLWAFGYGFGLAFWRSTWRARWFRDLAVGEDADFIEGLLSRGGNAMLLQDRRGRCLRGIHAETACAWWASPGPERPPSAGEDVPGPAKGSALWELATLLCAEWDLKN